MSSHPVPPRPQGRYRTPSERGKLPSVSALPAAASGHTASSFTVCVSQRAGRTETRHRARLEWLERNGGDCARIARALTNVILSALDVAATSDDGHMRKDCWVDAAGNTTVELRCDEGGIPARVVAGLFEPLLETYAQDALDRRGRISRRTAVSLCVDIWMCRPLEGGSFLRVFLHADANGELPSLDAPELDELPEPPRLDGEIRRGSGICVRVTEEDADLERALAFASGDDP